MNLNNVMIVLEAPDDALLSAFLTSREVVTGKFGSVARMDAVLPGQAAATHLIQTDGFNMMVQGRRLQITYALPEDYRELDDLPFSHLAERCKRLSRVLSETEYGLAAWIGILCNLREPDSEPSSSIDAIKRWVHKTGAPADDQDLVHFSVSRGVNRGNLYQGMTIQSYEVRAQQFDLSDLKSGEPAILEINNVPIIESGMEFILDINTKPSRKAVKVGAGLMKILEHAGEKLHDVIRNAVVAMGGHPDEL